MKNYFYIFKYLFFLFSFFFLFFVFSNFFISAQEECQTKQECEALLKKYEEQIAQYKKKINKTHQEKKTFQNKISILKTKIEKLKLQIQQSNILIKDLSFQIEDTESSIEKTSIKIEDSEQKLIDILRTIYEEDQKSLIEILFSNPQLSDFFNNLMNLESLGYKNQELLESIKKLKTTLEKQKQSLKEEKEDLERISKVQTLQKKEVEEIKKEQEQILKMTEKQYQKYLKEKKELEKRVAEVTKKIAQLTLAGLKVPVSPKELYELAESAGKLTGARPALILGLIEVESALGVNVGQCNCAGQPVCRHPELSYKQVMRSNQWSAFETITKELGLNPNTTPISCYIGGGQIQMGGAMGPAQFMPNTWLNLGYKQRVENLTGIKPANPWRPTDAFLATALYLADFNASTKKRSNEMEAVTAYLCGTPTMTPRCQASGGEWYRNLVMEKTDKWQEWINEGF